MNDLALTPNHQQVTAALSLLDDYTSLTVRKGAAQYLTGSLSNQDSELIEPAIQRIWTCASQESNPLVVAEYLKTLGTLKERAANSIPLIAHYLGHQDKDIALAATKALCDLSDTVPTAWIPLLAACPENIQAETIRDAKFLALKESDPAKYNIYESELSWIKGRPKAQQSAWLSGLDTKKTLGDFSESERCRFLLLYSDPRGENLWGCMKFLQQIKSVTISGEQYQRAKGVFCAISTQSTFRLKRDISPGFYRRLRLLLPHWRSHYRD